MWQDMEDISFVQLRSGEILYKYNIHYRAKVHSGCMSILIFFYHFLPVFCRGLRQCETQSNLATKYDQIQSLYPNPEAEAPNRGLDPQLRRVFDYNPDFLYVGVSPDTMQRVTTMQRAIRITLEHEPSTRETGQSAGATGTGSSDNMGMDMLRSNLASSSVAPEEPYAAQLPRLEEMGFCNAEDNIRALSLTAGDVDAAAEWLLRNRDAGQLADQQ